MIFVFHRISSYFKWLKVDKSDDGYFVKEESDTSALLKYFPFGEVTVVETVEANINKMLVDNRGINLQFSILFFVSLSSDAGQYDMRE